MKFAFFFSRLTHPSPNSIRKEGRKINKQRGGFFRGVSRMASSPALVEGNRDLKSLVEGWGGPTEVGMVFFPVAVFRGKEFDFTHYIPVIAVRGQLFGEVNRTPAGRRYGLTITNRKKPTPMTIEALEVIVDLYADVVEDIPSQELGEAGALSVVYSFIFFMPLSEILDGPSFGLAVSLAMAGVFLPFGSRIICTGQVVKGVDNDGLLYPIGDLHYKLAETMESGKILFVPAAQFDPMVSLATVKGKRRVNGIDILTMGDRASLLVGQTVLAAANTVLEAKAMLEGMLGKEICPRDMLSPLRGRVRTLLMREAGPLVGGVQEEEDERVSVYHAQQRSRKGSQLLAKGRGL